MKYQNPFSIKQKERNKTYFFSKSMRSGNACAVIISGAHIIPKLQRENMNLWYHKINLVISQIHSYLVISQNRISDIHKIDFVISLNRNEFVISLNRISDITKSI